ncbi:MAG: DciA family protein [Methylophilaceae bacterium]
MRRLNTLLSSDKELKTLTAKAEKIAFLQKIWESVAPPPFNQHSHAGSIRDGLITLYTSSGAVSAKLKLLTPQLLKKLQKEGVEVTAIRVEVQVKSQARAPARLPLRISPRAAQNLLDLAKRLPESSLQNALKKLAERSQN